MKKRTDSAVHTSSINSNFQQVCTTKNAAKPSAPPWLNRKHPVLASSGVCFLPTDCRGDDWQIFLYDACGNVYRLEQCQPATIDSFDQPRKLITSSGNKVVVVRHPQGLLVRLGDRRKLVKLPDPGSDFDESLEAALSLARAFDGAVVEGVDDDS